MTIVSFVELLRRRWFRRWSVERVDRVLDLLDVGVLRRHDVVDESLHDRRLYSSFLCNSLDSELLDLRRVLREGVCDDRRIDPLHLFSCSPVSAIIHYVVSERLTAAISSAGKPQTGLRNLHKVNVH